MRKITKFVLHHSASKQKLTTVLSINNSHRNRNWGTSRRPIYAKRSTFGYYAQYHYFINHTGQVTQLRSESEIGWHAGRWMVNKQSIGICMGGNFQTEIPTPEQLKSCKSLLRELREKYPNAELNRHKDIKPTACPGKWWTIQRLKNLLKDDKMKEHTVSFKLYKTPNSPRIYLEGQDGLLHHITSMKTLNVLVGLNPQWNTVSKIDSLQISFSIGDK